MQDLLAYREKVNQSIENFLNRKFDQKKEHHPKIEELLEHIVEFNLRGGKRIRPLAVIAAYKCFKDDDIIVDASICIEFMQSYLLIHDDILDNSDLRRGKPSMHKIYEAEHVDPYFGKSIAILAGNLCAAFMYDAILESDFPAEQKIRAIKILAEVSEHENYGQCLDMSPNLSTLSEAEVLKIYQFKTAEYTTRGPVLIGAALAGASSLEQIQALEQYGNRLGIAFQIQDDIQGIFGKVESIGKPNGSDIKEGKKTLLICKTLEYCTTNERRSILNMYGRKDLCDSKIDKLRTTIQRSGALEYCQQLFTRMIHEGKEAISCALFKDRGRQYLTDIADYISGLSLPSATTK